MSFINLRSASYGRQASLNSVEHFIIQKLILLRCSTATAGRGGVNLIAADATSPSDVPPVKEDAAVYGSFPWQYRSAAELNRPTDQVLLEGELREALIRIHPGPPPAQCSKKFPTQPLGIQGRIGLEEEQTGFLGIDSAISRLIT